MTPSAARSTFTARQCDRSDYASPVGWSAKRKVESEVAKSRNGAPEARLSPLFTWRSAIASEDGPADFDLAESGDSEDKVIVKGTTQRHVALTLSLHMNERGGSCYPGIARIARESGLSTRAIQKALRALAKTGWITVAISESPEGTNLYSATIPASYMPDEGGVSPVQGANGVPSGGEPGTPKDDKESEVSTANAVETVSAAWKEKAPPLIQHRDSYLAAGKTRTAIRAALRVYPADVVAEAISNYATCLGGAEYRWSHSWTLVEFLKRGLDRFVPEADPLRRERVASNGRGPVTAGDFAHLDDFG